MASKRNISVEEEEEEEESFSYATQLVDSAVLPMSLYAAVELGIFDIIAKAGEGAKVSALDIVAKMSTNNREAPMMVDRILRLLASYSVFGCSVVCDDHSNGTNFRRLYSLNSVSKHFVTNEDGVSMGPLMALSQDKVFLDSW